MIEIKLLTANGLRSFINSDEFTNMEHIPISTHRALSHIANPRLIQDDIVLLLAYKDDILAGYLGALPDKIFIGNEKIHIAWLSCLWVNSNMRRMGIAVKLLSKANELWDSNLLITNFTPQAKGSYDKLNVFTELKTYKGIRGYLRMNLHQLLPNKNPKYNSYKFILMCFDIFANIFIGLKITIIRSNYKPKQILKKEIVSIDKELAEFINENNKNELTRRDGVDIDWIIKYPWLKETKVKDAEALKYEFSSVAKNFDLKNYKIFDRNNNLIGYIMMHMRDRQLQIPYVYLNENNIKEIVNVIYTEMINRKLRTLTVHHPVLVNYISNNRSPFFLRRGINRTYLITEKLKNKLSDIDSLLMQDGDGDSAFT